MSSLIREQCYIDGDWVGASSGKSFPVTNPANGKVIANVPDMDGNDTRKAIEAAHKVMKDSLKPRTN
jgi:succinate-semialdehyde dehydrogenase/glutarate-semialdehyde dehydrogenase